MNNIDMMELLNTLQDNLLMIKIDYRVKINKKN